jgi:uncharacterized phage protein gp47/JayE
MSGTTTSPTACYVDITGIHAPAFSAILSYLQTSMQNIFGTDIVLTNDSQDGQMLGIFAQAIYDNNSAAIAVYNSYSPSSASGVGLSSVVKINGISRNLPTNSSATIVIVGVAGTIITNGIVTDLNNNNWVVDTVVIPSTGQITTTAVAQISGAVTAPANTIKTIATPILGWQTVTNPQAAVEGTALESDATLRGRQTTSTMLPSVTALDGMVGAVAAVPGVTAYQVYENDTSAPDSNGVPSHSIAFVVSGGSSQAIANAIAVHKTPGAGTYGNTKEIVVDAYGVPHNINFFTTTFVPITVVIHLTALNGYTSNNGADIVNAVVLYINSNPIGSNVYLTKVITIANLFAPETLLFNITSVLMAPSGGTPVSSDVVIAFNAQSSASTTTVSVVIP